MKVLVLEAVDQSARASRILKLHDFARRMGKHAGKLSSRSIGYRGAAPNVAKKPMWRGNQAASDALATYASAKSTKASILVGKLSSKFHGGKKFKPDPSSVIRANGLDGAKQMAKHIFKTRASRNSFQNTWASQQSNWIKPKDKQ